MARESFAVRQGGPHNLVQLLEIERLEEVVEYTMLKDLATSFDRMVAGQDNHGQSRANLPENLNGFRAGRLLK